MTKADLVVAASEVLACRSEDAAHFVDGLLALIEEGVCADGRAVLRGFGVFEQRTQAATTARNVHAQTLVTVPPRETVAFRPARRLRDVTR